MTKFEKMLTSRRLREEGQSIKSIAMQLGVSKGSVSLWCRDILISFEQSERLSGEAAAARDRGRLLGAESNRRKKREIVGKYMEQGKKDIGSLSSDAFLVVGAALYWAEGRKSGRLTFTNSDPDMIRVMAHWLQIVLGVRKEDFMPRICINEIHRPRIDKVLQFWCSLLELPAEQFSNTTFIQVKQSKVYENYDNYYGVLALVVRRGTEYNYRVQGLIEAMKTKMPG